MMSSPGSSRRVNIVDRPQTVCARLFRLVVIQLSLFVACGMTQNEVTCYCNTRDCDDNKCRTTNQCYAAKIWIDRMGGTEYGCTSDVEDRCQEYLFLCCFDKDYCNEGLNPKDLSPLTVVAESGDDRLSTEIVVITIVVLAMLVIALAFTFICRKRIARLNCKEVRQCGARTELERTFLNANENHAEKISLLNEVQLRNKLAVGGYGEVWSGVWRERAVAAKLISSINEQSFLWELKIYKHYLQSHPNILACLGSDTYAWPEYTAHCLIVELHPTGALHDFLLTHRVPLSQALMLSHSLVNGLRHLHTSVVGHIPKPYIAHRDLKSKNVLVKNNGECCVADFGLAAYHKSFEEKAFIPPGSELAGTRRYAPPELVSGALRQGGNIQAYTRGDMYSLGLVLWEIARCTYVSGQVADGYQLPYGNLVSDKPTLEEMADVVHVKGQRPTLSPHWLAHPILDHFCQIMTRCWMANADLRPSADDVIGHVKRALKLGSVVASPMQSYSV